MSESKGSSTLGWVFWSVIWACVGYFEYGSVDGALAMLLLSIVTGVTAIFGVIPIIGIGLTWWANKYVIGWLLGYVASTWIIEVISLASLGMSIVLTMLVIILVVTQK